MFVLASRSINLLFIDAVSQPNLVQPVQEFSNKFDDYNVLTISLMKRSHSFQSFSCIRSERSFLYRTQRRPTAQLLTFLANILKYVSTEAIGVMKTELSESNLDNLEHCLYPLLNCINRIKQSSYLSKPLLTLRFFLLFIFSCDLAPIIVTLFY